MAGYKETTTRVSETFAMSLEKFTDLKKSVDAFNADNEWKKKGQFEIIFIHFIFYDTIYNW